MEEKTNVIENYMTEVIQNADRSKPEAVKAANETCRIYLDSQVEEAKLLQKEREMDIRERELKAEKTRTYIDAGVKAGTTALSAWMVVKWMKFVKDGNAITDTIGKSVLSAFKLFR